MKTVIRVLFKRVLILAIALTATPLTAASPTAAEHDLLRQDPAIDRNWGLGALSAERSWRISRGSRAVIVAVIDTGVDVLHPDLAENIWKNPSERLNGIDDDGNGYIDDIHGWNFADGNRRVADNHGHGTHIAGIIGAVGGNGIGISGVSPHVSIMALKYYEPYSPKGNAVENTVAAIRYAVRMGAHIINYSAGGPAKSDQELEAIREAGRHGVLFIAAAGNERSNSDVVGYYPADYDLTNILSVTALDPQRSVLPSSNYGVKTVDIAAPGQAIYSTLPGGRYGALSGTSQATAFATGVAALWIAKNGLYRAPEKVIEGLVRTGDPGPQLVGKTKYRVSLNSFRALAIEDIGVSAAGARIVNVSSTAAFAEIAAVAKQIQALAPRALATAQRGPAHASLLPPEARPK